MYIYLYIYVSNTDVNNVVTIYIFYTRICINTEL